MPEIAIGPSFTTEIVPAFRGMQSYTENEADIFFGRDKETDRLYHLIKSNTLTLVFGKSGTGKTSLLNAGVFPLLREDDCMPFPIRLRFNENSPALMTQIMDVLKLQINTYGFTVRPFKPTETLWEFFHREDLWKVITPILIFDQFEEIFTLLNKNTSKKQELDRVITELSDLIENTIPETIKEKYLNDTINIEFNYRKQKAKVIFAFREDFLPDIESITSVIPSVKNSRFRLLPMNTKQAYEVITKTWKDTIDVAEAKKVVSYLTNETESESIDIETSIPDIGLLEIEPSLLSQVCSHLDQKRLEENLIEISAGFLEKYPKGIILQSIYHKALEESIAIENAGNPKTTDSIQNRVQLFIEDHLVNEDGYRIKFDTKEISKEIKPGITLLIRKYFIREEGESIELAHDVIATIVKSDRDLRRKEIATLEAKKKARNRAVKIVAIACVFALLAGSAAAYYLQKANDARKEANAAEIKLATLTDSINQQQSLLDSAMKLKIPSGKPITLGDTTELVGLRKRVLEDSMSLMMLTQEINNVNNELNNQKEISRSSTDSYEKNVASLQGTIAQSKNKVRDLALRNEELNARKKWFRSYASHMDSIIRFNNDTAMLQYHIRIIKQHQAAFTKILDL